MSKIKDFEDGDLMAMNIIMEKELVKRDLLDKETKTLTKKGLLVLMEIVTNSLKK